jgi:cysteine desulfurase
MKEVYLDYAATAPIDLDVKQAVDEANEKYFGNASSLHTIGQRAKGQMEQARETIARYINAAEANEVYFTSGGTESDNWAIKGIALAQMEKGKHIITSAIEHHAVLHACEFMEKMGFEVTYLPVARDGSVRIADLKAAIREDTILITIMAANNEIGTIQPIKEIGEIARKRGILFHTDAVQALGSMPLDVQAMQIDLMSISAHKVYGPKGVGAMYIKKGTEIENLMHGGAHELRRRAGTNNVPGIVGFGKAVELLKQNEAVYVAHYTQMRDYLRDRIENELDEVILNGHQEKRLPNNLNVSFAYVEGEALLLSLDMEGICVSTGSACSSGSLKPSHVIEALGLDENYLHGTVRFTVGRQTTKEDIDYTVDRLKSVIARLRSMSPLYKDSKNS